MKVLFSALALLLTVQVSSMTIDPNGEFQDSQTSFIDLEASHHHSSSGSSCSSSSNKPRGNNSCKCRICPMGPPGPAGATGPTGATGTVDIISFANFGNTLVETIGVGSPFSVFTETYINNNNLLLTTTTTSELQINQTGFFSIDFGVCALAPTGASATDFSTTIALATATSPTGTGTILPQSAIAAHASINGETTSTGSCIVHITNSGTYLGLFNTGPNSITVGGTGANPTLTSFLKIEKISN